MSRFWLFALPAVAGAFLASRSLALAIADTKERPVQASVDYAALWHGEAPCEVSEVFDLPPRLPNTSKRTADGVFENGDLVTVDWDADGIPMWRYRHVNGHYIRVGEPVLQPYQVTGATMREVEKELKAFQRENGFIVSADRGSRIRRHKGGLPYISMQGSYVLEPSHVERQVVFRIVYPEWSGYEAATPIEKRRWDLRNCHALHHALGHVQISLDTFGEKGDRFDGLSATTRKQLRERYYAVSRGIYADARDRLDTYYDLNKGFYGTGWMERPYRELPWPWLEDTRNDELEGLRPRQGGDL